MTTHATAPSSPAPAISVAHMQRRLATELSTRARVGFTALSLVAAAMGTVALSLWAGEPDLPARTQVAFGLMTAIAICLVAFALWTLTRRRVLLAQQALVAARMSVTFTGVFVAFFLLLTLTGAVGPSSAIIAVPLASVMLMAALVLLVKARRRVFRLRERCRALEQDVARAPALSGQQQP
jgi:peptidoglycan/LPS O-acetylase OafA/YrhL